MSQSLGSSVPSPGFRGIAQGLMFISVTSDSVTSLLNSPSQHIFLSLLPNFPLCTNMGDSSLISTQNTYVGHLCIADLTESIVPWRVLQCRNANSWKWITRHLCCYRFFSHPAIRNSSLAPLFPQTTASCHVARPPISLKNPISMLPCFPGCCLSAFLPQFPLFYYEEKVSSWASQLSN